MAAFRRPLMALVIGALSFGAALSAAVPGAVKASHTAAPASVTVAGSLQSELGCGGDWDPACAATHLTYDANDQVWQGAFTVPAGTWEYKLALNDSWTENYGANATFNGASISFTIASVTTVKFYYDHASHWAADNIGSRIVTVPGSHQSELGCPGDWQPDCLRAWLQDTDGDGTYTLTTTALAAGSYETKAAINEGWDENYGNPGGNTFDGANVPFAVAANNEPVTFSFVSATNTLSVQVGGGQPPSVEDVNVVLREGGQVNTAPVLLSWSAGDDVSADVSLVHQIQFRRMADGSWGPWRTGGSVTGVEESARIVPTWREFQYRVRTRDEAQNWSDWAESNPILVLRRQERHFTRGAEWTIVSMSGAMKGKVAVSSTPGATAQFGFVGNGVAAVMPVQAGYGTAEICVDPGTATEACETVDLATFTPSGNRRLVAAFTHLSSGPHVLRVTVVSGMVMLDGALFSK